MLLALANVEALELTIHACVGGLQSHLCTCSGVFVVIVVVVVESKQHKVSIR